MLVHCSRIVYLVFSFLVSLYHRHVIYYSGSGANASVALVDRQLCQQLFFAGIRDNSNIRGEGLHPSVHRVGVRREGTALFYRRTGILAAHLLWSWGGI